MTEPDCQHTGHELRDGEWYCLYCGEAHEPEPIDRTVACDCTTPLLIPCSAHHRGDELPSGRDWLICVVCGHWHQEADVAKINLVHKDQARWEADQAAEAEQLAAIPLCQRHNHTHRFIALRGGQEVCRDCAGKRADLEAP